MNTKDWKNGPQSEAQEKELFLNVAQQMRIEIEGRKIWLNHFPFLCYSGVYRDQQGLEYALYGHVHSGKFSNDGKDCSRLVHTYPTQYDVGVDNNDFAPIPWGLLNEKIEKQILKSKKLS